MQKRNYFNLFWILLILFGCETKNQGALLSNLSDDQTGIRGRTEYLQTPMVTAGNRVYMVGHQDGSFPELGWHIKGEMGGIWNHPIKLMDGFDVSLTLKSGNQFLLSKATEFVNYPFFNKHSYEWSEENINIERYQFVPDNKEGMLFQYEFINKGEPQEIVLTINSYTDLRPTWLGERTQMIDGVDQASWDVKNNLWRIKDSLNSWFTLWGSNVPHFSYDELQENVYKGKGAAQKISYKINIPAGSSNFNFVVAGSYTSESEALATYNEILKDYPALFQKKKERYNHLARHSKLTIPDKKLEQTFEWLKYNCDWLVRTVPEIGTGIGAGIPDYPWWFGVDSEYALQGYMAIGQDETVYSTIKLIDSVSNSINGNGRILHEMSTNGAVFNPGNINETPQFASLIWKIYQWNGDQDFLKAYYPNIEKGLEWLLQENDENGNLFPDGFGMMEIHGMDSEMIDVASYSYKAFADASKMARELGKHETAKKYEEISVQLKDKINTEFWSDAFQSYADFIGTDSQALKLIDDAIVRADTLDKPWAVTELNQTKTNLLQNPSSSSRPFVLHHNWVVNTPMEVGLAPYDQAIQALRTAENFVNPFGVFVTGIDRDESAGSDEGSFKGSKVFSYTGAVMTLPSGVQAISENNYGRPDHALNYLKRMVRTFSYALPGSMYEVSPDYGMMTQAWNIYSFAIPIVEQFFGIQPMAFNDKIRIHPQMPKEWDVASLENVKVGSNEISMFYTKTDTQLQLKIVQNDPDWELELILPKTKSSSIKAIEGSPEIMEDSNEYIIAAKTSQLIIEINYD